MKDVEQKAMLYAGRWRTFPNPGAAVSGTIHADARARELGFRSGPVRGQTVAGAMIPAIVHTLGAPWFEGGWFHVKMIAPLYADDQARETATAVEGRPEIVELRLLTTDGRLTGTGRAGLGTAEPWDRRLDGRRGGEVAFPSVRLGAPVAEVKRAVTEGDVAELCDPAGDDTPWFRGRSPWGDAVAPPLSLIPHDMQAGIPPGPGVLDEAMAADYQIVVERPVFVGEPLVVSARWADKGVSGRCWFRTIEFVTRDAAGRRCVAGRPRVKWFVEAAGSGSDGDSERGAGGGP